MLILFRRLWAFLGLAVVCAVVPCHVRADPPTPAASAWQLDLGAEANAPVAAGLSQDLAPLLADAYYRRGKDDRPAADHQITTVSRIIAALRAHRGLAWVALGARRDGGPEVVLQDLYVLDGAPIGGALPPAAGPAPVDRPGLLLDLQGEPAKPLHQSLQGHLEALRPPAGVGAAVSVEAVIAALQGAKPLLFVVLVGRDGAALGARPQVFVVPDVLRLSITDSAMAAAVAPPGAGAPAQAQIVPGEPGQPPRIRVDIDLEQYDTTQPPGRP
jgi:hypothetical protein